MSGGLPLSLEAVDLLWSISETPEMVISATALDDFHKKAGSALLTAGAIKPDGFEAVTVSQADHDDAIVSVTWSSELGGYAYFSPSAGLVRVNDHRLRRFKLDVSWLLRWIYRQVGFGASVQPVCLIPDRFWDFGDIWLGTTKRMRRRTAVYLARRLTEPETIRRLTAVLGVRRSRPGKVILTTTNELDLATAIIADTCAVLPVKTCARAGIDHFELDPNIIYSAAHGLCVSSSKTPVQVAADFRFVQVGDRQFRFRGDKQRQVIGTLYRRWEQEEGPVSTALMFEELGWPETNRLQDLSL